jgi:hypothetical protein
VDGGKRAVERHLGFAPSASALRPLTRYRNAPA